MEENLKYLVMEIQTDADGEVANLVWAFGARLDAESKYHAVLSAAAASAVPLHAASLLRSDGSLLECRSYAHAQEGE